MIIVPLLMSGWSPTFVRLPPFSADYFCLENDILHIESRWAWPEGKAMVKDARQPVIVGVGEIADRPVHVMDALDPAGLMTAALEVAERDAGAALLPMLDRLDIINEISWPYPDPCREITDRLGVRSVDARYRPVGGQTPTLALHEAALAIQSGEIEVAAICGGEAEHSVRRAGREGVTLPWPEQIANFRPIRGGDFQSPLARALELTTPVNVYPLYENATRAAWGQSLAEGQRESATIWANNARIGAGRDTAWIRDEVDADAILSDAGGNRLIAWPYRKLMVANPIVNQGAAVILTSLGRAREAGIPEHRLVYVHGGAAADEPRDILARERYDGSVVMTAVLDAARRLSGGNFDAVELYSCFPCVPKMARRALSLGEDADLTVTGGLTFFGAPLNDYMTHAIVAMVGRLRDRCGLGLLYGQGEYVTKHHALVLGSSPPASPLADQFRLEEVEARAATAGPPLATSYLGPATLEAFTIPFDRDERPRFGVMIGRNPAGERVAARIDADDHATMTLLMRDQPAVGINGIVVEGENDVPCWRVS
ncbi:acetyl-CoA acetyltransferase [Sphingomonas sp. RHCKR47]|uniref:acetyl-CoA acetyltransferase n=1 Tax=Sphingomonas citricola TaxID=2862498 RepID=UPI001CA4F565|nr:acetyl-CoA acetyltransferase [Sphingomonas citricola]MBW6522673.1 acetyl-CoA acetyltransferase [Sphingomonas citricola]